ncbi:MAG: hypothetical protein HYU51_06730 [Candidatus Rokubacteria bacterium]|nr:hypothetical protein [Candidatus Rokubacteria bacterium]
MARRTDEIQADIALTRQLIERELDALGRRLPDRWWIPYATIAVGFAVGLALSRVPMLTLISTAARTVQTGLALAGAFAAMDRFAAARHDRPATDRRRAA